MPESAQYEPDDKRLQPVTAADSALWAAATWATRYRVPLGIAVTVLIVGIVAWRITANAKENDRIEAAAAVAAAFASKEPPQALEAVIARWPGSDAAAQASLQLGDMQFQLGDFARAAETLRDFLTKYPEHPLAASAQLSLAASLEAKGELPTAIEAYQNLLAHFPNSHHAPEARLGLGRCSELQGQWETAKREYEDILNTSQQWANQAQERLIIVNRHLNAVRASTPPVTPAPAAAAPTPATPAPATPAPPTPAPAQQ